jgi:hypothetical protein
MMINEESSNVGRETSTNRDGVLLDAEDDEIGDAPHAERETQPTENAWS